MNKRKGQQEDVYLHIYSISLQYMLLLMDCNIKNKLHQNLIKHFTRKLICYAAVYNTNKWYTIKDGHLNTRPKCRKIVNATMVITNPNVT